MSAADWRRGKMFSSMIGYDNSEVRKMDEETSIGIFEMGSTMTLAVDGKQPPGKPTGRSVGAAAVDDVVPSIVIARRATKGGQVQYVMQVHHMSGRRKQAFAKALGEAAKQIGSSTTDDDRSFDDRGFTIDLTAALREPS
jgi:hypothetical protein